jgi:hypothetical protein
VHREKGFEVSYGVRMPYILISRWIFEEVRMNRMMKCAMILVIAVLAVSAVFAEGQAEAAYPERDITCIIPFGQGGGTDVWARKVMESMAKDLKVSITTTNVTGGSAGSIGISQVWNSPHDGYVLAATSETPPYHSGNHTHHPDLQGLGLLHRRWLPRPALRECGYCSKTGH